MPRQSHAQALKLAVSKISMDVICVVSGNTMEEKTKQNGLWMNKIYLTGVGTQTKTQPKDPNKALLPPAFAWFSKNTKDIRLTKRKPPMEFEIATPSHGVSQLVPISPWRRSQLVPTSRVFSRPVFHGCNPTPATKLEFEIATLWLRLARCSRGKKHMICDVPAMYNQCWRIAHVPNHRTQGKARIQQVAISNSIEGLLNEILGTNNVKLRSWNFGSMCCVSELIANGSQ